jgi:chromosome segregation ATPase
MATTLSGVALTRATELFEPYVLKPYTVSSDNMNDSQGGDKSVLRKRSRNVDSYDEAVRKIDELMGFEQGQTTKDSDDDIRDFILKVQRENKDGDRRKQDAIEKIGHLLGKTRKRRTVPQNRIVVDAEHEQEKKEQQQKKKEEQLSELRKGIDDYQKGLKGDEKGFRDAPIVDSVLFENKPMEKAEFTYNKGIENEEAARKFLDEKKKNPFGVQGSTVPVEKEVITLAAELNQKTTEIASLRLQLNESHEQSKTQKENYERLLDELKKSKLTAEEKQKEEEKSKVLLERAYEKAQSMLRGREEGSQNSVTMINQQLETIKDLEEAKNTLLSEKKEIAERERSKEEEYNNTKRKLQSRITLLEHSGLENIESINNLQRKLTEAKEKHETVAKESIVKEKTISQKDRELETEKKNLEMAKYQIGDYQKQLASLNEEKNALTLEKEDIQNSLNRQLQETRVFNQKLIQESSDTTTQYNQTLQKMSEEKEELEKALTGKEEEIENYSKEIDEIQNSIAELSSQYEERVLEMKKKHNESLETLKKEANEYYSELIQKKEKELTENHEEIQSLNEKLKKANSLLEEQKRRNDSLSLNNQSSIASLEKRIRELSQEMLDKDSNHFKEIQRYIDSLNGSVSASDRVIALENSALTLRNENNSLTKRIQGLEMNLQRANEILEEKNNKIKEKDDLIQNQKAIIREREEAIGIEKRKLEESIKKLGEAESKLVSGKQQLTNASNDIDALQLKLANLGAANPSNEEEIKRLNSQISQGNETVKEMNIMIGSLQLDLETANGFALQKMQDIEKLEKKIATKEEALKEAETMTNGKDDKINKLQEDLDESERQLNDLRNKFHESVETIDTLTQKLEEVQKNQMKKKEEAGLLTEEEKRNYIAELEQKGKTIGNLQEKLKESEELEAQLEELVEVNEQLHEEERKKYQIEIKKLRELTNGYQDLIVGKEKLEKVVGQHVKKYKDLERRYDKLAKGSPINVAIPNGVSLPTQRIVQKIVSGEFNTKTAIGYIESKVDEYEHMLARTISVYNGLKSKDRKDISNGVSPMNRKQNKLELTYQASMIKRNRLILKRFVSILGRLLSSNQKAYRASTNAIKQKTKVLINMKTSFMRSPHSYISLMTPYVDQMTRNAINI